LQHFFIVPFFGFAEHSPQGDDVLTDATWVAFPSENSEQTFVSPGTAGVPQIFDLKI
jgi:hypothetical protein